MTLGDQRAEAARLAKVRGPAWVEGYAAALAAMAKVLADNRENLHPVHECTLITALDLVTEMLGELELPK